MADAKKPSVVSRIRMFLSDIRIIHWLISLAVSAGIVAKVTQKLPATLSNPQVWFTGLSVLCGTLVMTTATIRTTAWAWKRKKMWRNPPCLEIVPHGGKYASIEIKHRGEPIEWEVHARILQLESERVVPMPLLRQCFIRRNGECFRSLRLLDGELANVILAIIRWSHPLSSFRETWVSAVNAEDQYGIRVPSGFVMEVTFDTKPRIAKYSVKQCFQIDREDGNVMRCVETKCT